MPVHGKVLLCEWRYGMSTVPYEQQKNTDKINNLIITREASLTPREPSISYDDVYGYAL